MKNIIRDISNKRLDKKGFTLVELLAVISILSIISVAVIVTATNIIGSSKDKSYMVTVNNIEKYTESYVVENDKSIFWLPTGVNNKVYQCITV